MKNSKTTFLRFVSAYLSIILLVLLSLFPIYVALNRAVHDNLSQSILNHAQNAAHELEATEDLLLHTARNVYNDPLLSSLYYDDSSMDQNQLFYNMCQLQERMKLYFRNIDGISDVIVYNPKFDYVLTQQYIFRTRSQFYDSIQLSSFGDSDWLENLRQKPVSKSIAADVVTDHLKQTASYPVVNYSFSFPMAGDYHIPLLIVVSLDARVLSEQFLYPEISGQERLIITDSHGAFLADSMPESTVLSAKPLNDRFYQLQFSGADGKHYSLEINPDYFHEQQLDNLQLIVQNIGLALILGACVSLYFAWRHSRPIERIFDIVRRANASDSDIVQFTQLEGGVLNMASEISQCKNTIRDLDSIVSHSLLERLFFGDFRLQKLQTAFIQYYGPMPSECFVIIFGYENPGDGELPETVILDGYSALQKQPYVTHIRDQKLYLVIQASEDIYETTESVLKEFRETRSIILKAGISNKISGLAAIRDGVRQAARRFNSGLHLHGIYLLAHTHSSKAQSNPLTLDSLNLLSKALLTWNRQTSDQALQEIFTQLESQKSDSLEYRQIFFSLRSVYSIIIEQFVQNIEKTGITAGEDLFLPSDLDEYNLAAIQTIFTALNAAMDKYYQQYTEKKSQIRGLDILNYVHENFRDPNLCANSIAEHFNISEKYVFLLMKKACGETLNDKISYLRVQEGIRLLKQTDMPITQIAAAVGFTSSNSMYKVFMRVNGVSPSSYRKAKS